MNANSFRSLVGCALLFYTANAVCAFGGPDDETEPAIVTFTGAEDQQHMKDLLGITKMRSGRSPNPESANAANTDESKANPYPVLPHLMMMQDGSAVTTPGQWWKQRPCGWTKGVASWLPSRLNRLFVCWVSKDLGEAMTF